MHNLLDMKNRQNKNECNLQENFVKMEWKMDLLVRGLYIIHGQMIMVHMEVEEQEDEEKIGKIRGSPEQKNIDKDLNKI